MSTEFFSVAAGIGTKNNKGEWLEVFYPGPLYRPDPDLIAAIAAVTGYSGGNRVIELDSATCHALEELYLQRNLLAHTVILNAMETSACARVMVILESDTDPVSTPEAYLKLHLLSHRLVRPHSINLNGIFALLPNIAWTNEGAIAQDELPGRSLQARARGEVLNVYSVDKFPPMSDYVVPKGVRIADTARVRLGAYIGEGTTVMHEGFVNFNAGTEGRSMIEGRISAGVWVGDGSDLGGGCSTMGTLSGGNDIVVSIGRNCLIGANAGVNIPLGDRCTIEAGLYLTARAKVSVLDKEKKTVAIVKAIELANKSDLRFWRNSQTGVIECFVNPAAIALNEQLHLHN